MTYWRFPSKDVFGAHSLSAAPWGARRRAAPKPAPSGKAATAAGSASKTGAATLLGEADTTSGESRRNENVQFNLIDNNARRDQNLRLGTTATLIREFEAEKNYFAAEFGNPPAAGIHSTGVGGANVHGQLFYRHLNSVTSARSFFQVGGVKPRGRTSTAPVFRCPPGMAPGFNWKEASGGFAVR